ncbi:hypothetical protein CR105_27170 [Massilia eurypsychrophila]|jgi:hypothetical protein|uniref:Uncharacterized protein n=1 Tax=Massilia eurypsychrophila TaxID=1485217 RepID=A0A2G8T769_9BURK|nr:hypothetical protein [Massilia eurypsychrophila]PIL41906.1 hypothetical protein CR105_27170 [Massilia eurypsychrophila]
MHSVSTSRTLMLAAVLAAVLAAPARSAEPAKPAPQQASALGVAAPDELLNRTRGGSNRTDIDMRLSGNVSGNAANNVNTGANIITNGSFSNMAGIPIVVQNTGANVLIQNATIINLRMN